MYRVEFNYQEIIDRLRATAERLEDMTPVHQSIGRHMFESTLDRFRQGIDPQGAPWAPKSPVTIEKYRREKHGYLPRPLIGPNTELSTDIIVHANASEVEIGSNLIQSAVMHWGAPRGAFGSDPQGRSIPWGDIPARPWLGISPADETAILDIAEEAIGESLDG